MQIDAEFHMDFLVTSNRFYGIFSWRRPGPETMRFANAAENFLHKLIANGFCL